MKDTPELTLGPGMHQVDPNIHAEALFALDCQVAYADDSMIAFESPDELTAFLHESDVYVLNDTEHAVGLLALTHTSQTTLEVLSVGVIPEAQGEGHGKTMMLWAEEYAKLTGKSVIELVAKTSNNRALAFYEHLGYAQKEVIAGHYSSLNDDEDRVRLEKYVQAS